MKKLLYQVILLASDRPTVLEKLTYWYKTIVAFGFVVALLDFFNVWFRNNKVFWQGMLLAFVLNMALGYAWHHKFKDFRWSIFISKNIKMWVITLCAYPLLEILALVAGQNPIAEGFKIVVQVSTLLYPGSKALKNAYLLSEKKYPPAFIMERVYAFEKTGDIEDLIKNKDENGNTEQ